MIDYNKERENLWKRLQKSGSIIDYTRHGDTRKYDIHLRDGLIIVVDDNNTTEKMTIDTFFYLWLENRQ
nr:MAG TPA: hypothetical protein [Caudoviricetes sp.]